jgi:G3E family GTPase
VGRNEFLHALNQCRSKGWLWLASRPKDVFVWNQSGSHFGLEWAATWKAAIVADPHAPFMREELDALAASVAAAFERIAAEAARFARDYDAALDAIRTARQGTRKAHRPAPEMACQVEAIRQAAARGPQRRR